MKKRDRNILLILGTIMVLVGAITDSIAELIIALVYLVYVGVVTASLLFPKPLKEDNNSSQDESDNN